jgi:predicted metal-binding membrane protein
MMAAMMLPGAARAVLKRAQASGGVRAVPLFVGSYLAVWALVGIAVYALDRPHRSMTAGAVVVAAGVYELTPVKRHFRRRCRDSTGSGHVHAWTLATVSAAAFMTCLDTRVGENRAPGAAGLAARYGA